MCIGLNSTQSNAGAAGPSNGLGFNQFTATDPNAGYTDWLNKNHLRESNDYDTQAAFKAGLDPSVNGHLPDTYKKPNHPTFSKESVYSTPEHEGGEWVDLGNDKWGFKASPYNLQNMSKDRMKRYFDRVEPGNTVIFPDGEKYIGIRTE